MRYAPRFEHTTFEFQEAIAGIPEPLPVLKGTDEAARKANMYRWPRSGHMIFEEFRQNLYINGIFY